MRDFRLVPLPDLHDISDEDVDDALKTVREMGKALTTQGASLVPIQVLLAAAFGVAAVNPDVSTWLIYATLVALGVSIVLNVLGLGRVFFRVSWTEEASRRRRLLKEEIYSLGAKAFCVRWATYAMIPSGVLVVLTATQALPVPHV